jgi:hypothetical protein
LIHYSGFGFAKRGAPLWLLDKISSDRGHIESLGIFFHELYAFGPPWRSAFWLSPAQRYIARRLAETSDYWITNRDESAKWLSRFAEEKPHRVLPVFSNVGETGDCANPRRRKAVVFGSEPVRVATYRAAGPALFSWARQQDIELHDIGPHIGDSAVLERLTNAGVVRHGRLEVEMVTKHLSESMAGVLAYPTDYVAKSGIFAAYCAHGLAPILISRRYGPSDGLIPGTHYYPGLPPQLVDSTQNGIRAAAWQWYQPHASAAHTSTFRSLLDAAGHAC